LASIRKRKGKNGKVTWQAAVYIARDADGTQLFEYVTCDTEKECKQKARALEQQRDEGKLSKIPNMRFSAWAKQWLEINEGRLSTSTYATYEIFNSTHFEPFFGKLKLNQITETHIKKFMSLKLKTLTKASVRRMMSVLKVMLHDALKQRSPMSEIKLPSDEKKEARVPTHEEFEKIRSDVKGTHYEVMILLAGWGGLRRGEILALKPDDLDKENCTIRVDESKRINKNSQYEDGRTKSENGIRKIVIPDELMDMLWEIRKKNPEKTRLFEMRPDALTRWFTRAKNRFNWPDITFHGLRHYHASWLYENEIPDQYASKRLGHTVKVLKMIYQHIGVDREKMLDDKIRQLNIKKQPKKDNKNSAQ